MSARTRAAAAHGATAAQPDDETARRRKRRTAPAGAKGTGAPRLGEPTLTAADWAEAALQLMAEAGVGGLTVDALAARLGVTKGSFYWHFSGRSALLAAALERWERRTTSETIAGLSAVTDPQRRLALIFGAASQPPRSRSLYAALGTAADDPAVGPVLSRVAEARIGYLERCYREIGLTKGAARAKALLGYAAYRGLLQLAREAPSELPADWSSFQAAVQEALVPPAPKDAPPRKRRIAGPSAPRP